MLNFSRLCTPPKHGDVLLEPPPAEMAALAEANAAHLRSYSFPILDMDVQALRSSLRQSLCPGCEGPLVMTGHQPEFIHAGVWAKHVVADRLSSALGGRAVNIIVDSDAPKEAALAVPFVSPLGVETHSIPFAQVGTGVAFECIPRWDDAGRVEFERRVREYLGGRFETSLLPQYFSALGGATDAVDWVDQVVHARRAVEHGLGVQLTEHRISRTWFGLIFADLLLHAPRFAACYNAALSDYRAANRVRSPNRPVPDLAVADQRVELPVWVYRLGESRRRLFVAREAERVTLFAGEGELGTVSLGELREWERARPALGQWDHVFRPRALALTLWARIFVADLFIHGIGGALYDRITDGLIRRFYGVEPPGMACASATLRMALPAGAKGPTVPEAVARRRDIRYNPQRHLERTEALGELIDLRAQAVAESITLRERAPRDRRARREVFGRIRRLSAEMVERSRGVLRQAEQDVTEAHRRARSFEAANRRDYFFAMLERPSAALLLDRLPSVESFRL